MRLEIFAKRLKLRKWAEMDDIRHSVKDALANEDFDKAADGILRSIGTCFFIPYKILQNVFWMRVLYLYTDVLAKNRIDGKFPILQTKRKENRESWEYEGRGWYFWLNIFAGAYGWKEKDIANLDPNDALGLYQEVVASEFAKREWQYGLSDIAYEYMPSTKKSRYRPLDKPDWMLPKIDTRKTRQPKIKIMKAMMPVGNVVDLDKNDKSEETKS